MGILKLKTIVIEIKNGFDRLNRFDTAKETWGWIKIYYLKENAKRI